MTTGLMTTGTQTSCHHKASPEVGPAAGAEAGAEGVLQRLRLLLLLQRTQRALSKTRVPLGWQAAQQVQGAGVAGVVAGGGDGAGGASRADWQQTRQVQVMRQLCRLLQQRARRHRAAWVLLGPPAQQQATPASCHLPQHSRLLLLLRQQLLHKQQRGLRGALDSWQQAPGPLSTCREVRSS